ncbi:hypothetical protein BJ912DRAFT_977520 [Pholiota molesta]|nr:hypothetical protein BJ912DRAFT_977520 [Pholiota molesta]
MSSLSTIRLLRSARLTPISRHIIRQPGFRRQAHNEATSPHDRAIPFSTSSRRALAIKSLLYMGGAFSIPFVAIWWHWNRPGGINNPL